MKTLTFKSKEEWFFARRGKITGTRLKDIIVKRGTEKKQGFFQVIAERLSTDPEGMAFHETPMERGTRLQPEAMEYFIEDTKKPVDQTLKIWMRDENESIAVSPDGDIPDEMAAVETKCLSSAHHIEAAVKKFFWKRSDWDSVPGDYQEQIVQYFCVNDTLQKVYMVFYDPRMIVKSYFYLTINRVDVQKEVAEWLEYQRKEIKEIDEITNFFSF